MNYYGYLWISEFSILYMVETKMLVWYDLFISTISIVMSHIYANKLLFGILANVSYEYVLEKFLNLMCVFVFKRKLLTCTHLGGASLSI